MRIGFGCHRDRVILDFLGRRRDLQLLPNDAERFAEEVEKRCEDCAAWMKAGGQGELVRGEHWKVKVQSWDGYVNLRFTRIGDAGLHGRVSIPYKVAQAIAHRVRLKATEARFRFCIEHNAKAAVAPIRSEAC